MALKSMKSAPSKGQTNLFSFFKKQTTFGDELPRPMTPATAHITPTSIVEYETPSDHVVQVKKIVEPAKSSSFFPTEKIDASLEINSRKRIMDVLEDDQDAIQVKKKSNTKVIEDEEEWNESEDGNFSESDDDVGIKRSRLKKGKELKKSLPPKPPLPRSMSGTPVNTIFKKVDDGHFTFSPDIQSNRPKPVYSTPIGTTNVSKLDASVTSDSGRSHQELSTLSLGTPDVSSLTDGVVGRGSHEHNFFDFMKPENRMDKTGKKMSHPDYNPCTLRIPDSFLKDQTPAMLQWWQFKCENMDTVLFFKVGKFYELFHMDADVGVSELDLIYMKGSKAHSGFPEISYGKYSSILVSKGYRVARVEQTETPEMLKERNETSGKKKDKVVRREVCSVMSKGTRTYCHLDDLSLLVDDDGNNPNAESILVCIRERSNHHNLSSDDSEAVEYGISCINTVLGNIVFAQFQDDHQRTRLRTFLLRYIPSEVLLHEDSLYSNTAVSNQAIVNIIKLVAPKALITQIRRSEFPDAMSTIRIINEGNYYKKSQPIDSNKLMNSYPSVLDAAMKGTSDGSSDLLLSAFGGCICHLKRSLIDYEILSLGKVFAYIPPDEQQIVVESILQNDNSMNEQIKSTSFHVYPSNISDTMENELSIESHENCNSEVSSMTIDAIALANLEVLVNNYDHTEKGSLWSFINRCKTPFGKRLLRSWLCHPLYHSKDIQYRRDAVNMFLIHPILSQNDQIQSLCSILKGIPDLERLLTRIYSNSLLTKSSNYSTHPDNRAVMYENDTYNQRKIKDFSDVLSGLQYIVRLGEFFHTVNQSHPIESKLLKQLTIHKLPYEEITNILHYYHEIFDEKQAKKDGYIRPKPGVNPSYDSTKHSINQIENDFENYLKELKQSTNIQDIKYFGNNKDRYQLEIPMNSVSKVPNTWFTTSQKKTHRRYKTQWIEKKLNDLIHYEEQLIMTQNDTNRQIFSKFHENYNLLMNVVTCCSMIDALYSLSEVSKGSGYQWPVIENRSSNQGAFIHVKNGRHPMLEHAMTIRGDTGYIPNSLHLGGKLRPSDDEYLPKLLLLTGPNMGGKSTLLRQTCLIIILAQIGCKVPAEYCRFTSVDRIFTRIGASDKILAGQSTFFVELAETAMILKYASEDSLCILDELGRGTATFDGTAIAHAVIDSLLRVNKSRVMFATHYHSLIDDWEIDPRVKLGHMDCIVQDYDNHNNDQSQVTFLYKLCDGTSPKSYGINVAKLAHLPKEVIDLAMEQSMAFETKMKEKSDQCNQSRNWKLMTVYYEKLVSIAHSTMTKEELVYVASELWRRLHSVGIMNEQMA